ncbi:hypothetical protein KZ820_14500 [Sphingomonas sp. RRHST34]|uniref:Uncharacterized protein n=1 Tax=Sphingomonas citri TaxID=2862499 RepID=A0ABS7BRB2_9SPHN|nr:hypothetical protein [Sphingomonas citri]MBW6531949.1 hypothetical protein [Sphingomonas citri]
MPDDSPPHMPEAENASWRRSLETVAALQARTREAGEDTAEADEKLRRTLELATDQELLTEWMKTTWESGDPAMTALAAEVERRGLDF